MASASARIVIAEAWSILRRGLSGVLAVEHVVAAEVDDVVDLSAALAQGPIDLVVVGLPRACDPAALVARLRTARPEVHVIVLCERFHPEDLRAVLQAGAGAALPKKVEDHDLRAAVTKVLRGERVVDQSLLPLLFGGDGPELEPPAGTSQLLTRREHDVLAELARGSSNREIARALLMSESTVKTHLTRIYEKLGVTGRHGAVGRAMELELLA